VNLFIQGMRRSGTTILYDALIADPELRCFYEQLREQDVTEGGGAREGDAFAETRELRERFQRERFPEVPVERFNWGGPREPALELEPHLPEHCRELLRWLLAMAPAVMIKETRLYRKVADVAALDPEAAFVHVVRDPRAVAASIILGRKRRRLGRWSSPGEIFDERTDRKLWSSRAISTALAAGDGVAADRLSDVEHILRVWKLCFESAYEDGRRLYGDRYLLLRNEDLRAATELAIESVYAVLGREAPPAVREWARANVREPETVLAADDPRWSELLGELELAPALEAAGYGDLAATLVR
jgi:sulfotransferase family protein